MNDQPSRPTSPAAPNPVADPTAAPAPAPAAPAPAGWDPTAAQPAAVPTGSAEPTAVQPPVTPQGNAEWPAEPAPAWGAPPATPYGAQSDASYGAQPGAPYGAQPGAPYGAQSGPAYGAPQPDGYPGFPPPGASPYPPPGSGGTSGFAIASLIFGILGGILLSVIFGIVALVQIRKRGQTGRGMAIAGLTLSGCWVLLIIIGVTAAILSDSGDSSSNTAAGSNGGSVSVTQLKPGDCINGIQTVGSVEDLPVISCALPHEGEVYATFNLPAGPWPGDSAVQKQAEKLCDAELKVYAPSPAATVEVLYLHPLQQSWSRDRGVTCVATDERGTTTGSVRD
ncbi:DUF4190 domain-containing protein [Actinoplanes auranticolor]|uniref:Regulator of septum formation n=1 Tax=Actinoplanes auranticolor TaxID=47988 RepID=A0A919SKD4_9ACTN|nr:DUF4190 domain-containing protein [Actinoplanes auranticolor]GIM73174.1 hypothetical protein Aau02nite_54650 [Actinoplanes auranticolor]